MTIIELKEFTKQYQELKTLAWNRGKQALFATETGFGEKCTDYEKVVFEEENIVVTCYDSCYDLRDESSYYLSFEELLMSEEEWTEHLRELTEVTQINNELRAKQERLSRLEQKEKEFERLKQELGK